MKHEIFGWVVDHEPKKLDDLFECVLGTDNELVVNYPPPKGGELLVLPSTPSLA